MKRYSFKEDGMAIGFLFLLAAFYFLPVLLQGNSLVLSAIGADTWSQYFYWRHFGYTTLAKGEMPLWNPYIFSGTPYVAGMQSAIFYPLNLVYLLFEPPFAINLSIATHCFLASLFTYLFARYLDIGRAGSILAAMTFAYGAPYFFHVYAGHLSNLSTMVWLPLILMGLEAWFRSREMKYPLLAGAGLGLQVLAGHTQYLFYASIAVFLYFVLGVVLRKELRLLPYHLAGFSVFVLTGLLLSAVQLLPALELTRHSVRAALTYEWVSMFSLPPEKLITLILPDFFGNMLTVPYWGKNYLWEMSVYFGLIPLALAVTALVLDRSRPVLVFSCIAAVALILALGKHTPLLTVLYDYVPGFNMFRGLSKFVFVFVFAASMIAGQGLKKITAMAEAKSPTLPYLGWGLVGFAVFFFSLGLVVSHFGADFWRSLIPAYVESGDRFDMPPLTEEYFKVSRALVSWDLLKASLICLLFGAILIVTRWVSSYYKALVPLSILALAGIELWSFGSRYLVTFDAKLPYMDRELKAFLKNETEPFRIATPLVRLLNMGLLEGIENVGGNDALVLRNYNEFINLAQRLPPGEPNLAMAIQRPSPMLDLLNVKYYILPAGVNIKAPTLDLAFENARYSAYRNKQALPRSFVVHDAWVIKEKETILQKIASADFSPHSQAVVEQTIDGLPRGKVLLSPLPKIAAHSPNRVLIDADLKAPGLLILADSYYPGWRAFVNGQETKIFRANYVMRAVFLPAGNQRVEFRYDPLSFKIGAIISVATLFLVTALGVFWFFRGRAWGRLDVAVGRIRPQLMGLLLVLLVLVVFGQTYDHGFVWDDGDNIVENPHFQPPTLANTLRFWGRSYQKLYVPLTYTVWSGLARIAQIPAGQGDDIKFSPRPFHLANVSFHLFGALVVFAILKMLVRRDWAAFGGALLFAWHPVQVEPVAWITGLKDVLSGFLSLVAIWLYLKHKRLPYVFSTLVFVLALLTKPAAIAVPVVAWVLDYLVLRRSMRQCALALGPWLILACPFIVVNKLAQPDAVIQFVTPLWARPLVAGDALTFYLYKLVFPVWLGPDYGRSPEWIWRQGWIYFSWILPCGVAVFIWVWRKRKPWLAAASGVLVAAILPVSGLVPFVFQDLSTVADRYLYLSMLGPALALAWFLAENRQRMVVALGVVILALLGVRSIFQIRHWQDETTLYRHALSVNPNSSLAHYNLGNALVARNMVDDAIAHFRNAVLISPHHPDARNNLGTALVRLGQLDEAIEQYRQAIRIEPTYAKAYYNLGNALVRQGRPEEAIEQYRGALRVDSSYSQAHNNLGLALVGRGDLDEGIKHLRRSLEIDPGVAMVHRNLGVALAGQGKVEEAVSHFRDALRIDPASVIAHVNLANLLASQGELDGAVEHYRRALHEQSDFAEAHEGLGRALALQGNWDGAVDHFRKALQIRPDFAEAHEGLGRLLALRGRREEAIKHLEEALRIMKAKSPRQPAR